MESIHCHISHPRHGEESTQWPTKAMVLIMFVFFVSFSLSARDFTYQGLTYTVIDEEEGTCRTKEGEITASWTYIPGNNVSGDIEIPSVVSDGRRAYTVIEVGEASFYDNDGLTSVRLPDTVVRIGGYAFRSCNQLLHIHLSATLCEMSEKCFGNCTSLESIVVPTGVESLPCAAFLGCYNLRECILPEGLKKIGDFAFLSCDRLATIVFPESLEEIGEYAFGNCYELKGDVFIPDSVCHIGTAAFSYCRSLTIVHLPNTLDKIYGETFVECISLESVEFPTALKSIEDPFSWYDDFDGMWKWNYGAFEGCESLKSISLPEGLTYVGVFAFTWCTNLETVVLPSSLDQMELTAFSYCKGLKKVIYPVSDPKEVCEYNAFTESVDATLIVGMGGADKAKVTSPWKYFKHIEEVDFSGVEGIESEATNSASDGVYRMDGTWVGDSTEGLPSGLYIVREGGKTSKVMVP